MSTSQNIAQWSVTAADNDDADTGVNWAEGQVPGTVNNSARAMMAALAKWRLDVGGALAAGGSANALTVTTNGLLEAAQLAAGLMLVVRATADNTNATVTFNPDSRGALNIKRADGSALAVGSIKSGMYLILFYNQSSAEWRAANIGPDPATIIATTIELGHASDTTLSRSAAGVLAVEGVTVSLNSVSAAAHVASTIELGHATDTTLARSSAGNVTIEGNLVYRAGGTDVALADGGTGASTAAAAAAAILAAGVDVTVSSPAILKRDGGASANATVMRVQRTDTSDVTDAELVDFFGGASTQVGSITTSRFGGVWNFTSYNTSSDGRVKTNKRPIDDAGAVIDRLNPVRFEWLSGGASDFGFIAQEVDDVVPGFVKKGDDNPEARPGDDGFKKWQMQYGRLEPFLVAELQSLRRRVAAIESA